MLVQIKRIDDDFPIPSYQTRGSVGFDIYSRANIVVEPKSLAKISGNILVRVPKGFALILVGRSSLVFEKGLMLACGVGIVDQDFFGENDEILVPVYNILDSRTEVKKGERLCQGIFVKISKADFKKVKNNRYKSRGGFGSTGGYI